MHTNSKTNSNMQTYKIHKYNIQIYKYTKLICVAVWGDVIRGALKGVQCYVGWHTFACGAAGQHVNRPSDGAKLQERSSTSREHVLEGNRSILRSWCVHGNPASTGITEGRRGAGRAWALRRRTLRAPPARRRPAASGPACRGRRRRRRGAPGGGPPPSGRGYREWWSRRAGGRAPRGGAGSGGPRV